MQTKHEVGLVVETRTRDYEAGCEPEEKKKNKKRERERGGGGRLNDRMVGMGSLK